MKSRKDEFSKKVPKVIINNNMKTYENDPFFVKKLADANEALKHVKLPEEFK